MTRRGILIWMLGIGAMSLPIPARLSAATSPPTVTSHLRELLADPECARAIGQVCLATCSIEADSGTLIKQLAADDLSIDAPIPLLGSARDRLRARIRRDFVDGRIAVVDGWHMSLTEVRLCTLSALL